MAVLDGIRVVVTGSAAALDMSSVLLSDNGAEVIRVEPPGGDIRRSLPAWRLWNRGTRSIVLDASAATDRAAADALVEGADVLLEAQGGASGLGWSFDYHELAARNPGLVHCTVTAFGRSGELSWLPLYDGVVEARSGANVDLGVTLGRQTPAYRARPNPSYATGNIIVQSIAAALLVRARGGRGQHIDTSLYQGLLAFDFASALRRQSELGELDPPLPAMTAAAGPFLPYLAVRARTASGCRSPTTPPGCSGTGWRSSGSPTSGTTRAGRTPRRPSPTRKRRSSSPTSSWTGWPPAPSTSGWTSSCARG